MLNETIKLLRKSRGLSQVELAAHLGITKQCVSNWENDNILPSIEMLVRLSEYFRVSTDYILGIDSRKTIDVSDLSDIQIEHIKLIISDIAH